MYTSTCPESNGHAHAEAHVNRLNQTNPDSAGATQSTETNDPAQQNGHDENGRFAKGNKGGPGNPFARKVAEMRSAFLRKVTAERVEALGDEIFRRAMEGDLGMAKLFMQYAIGKPAPVVNPDTLDTQEWQNLVNYAMPSEECWKILHSTPLNVALEIVKGLWPLLTQQRATKFYAEMEADDAEKAKAKEKTERARQKREQAKAKKAEEEQEGLLKTKESCNRTNRANGSHEAHTAHTPKEEGAQEGLSHGTNRPKEESAQEGLSHGANRPKDESAQEGLRHGANRPHTTHTPKGALKGSAPSTNGNFQYG